MSAKPQVTREQVIDCLGRSECPYHGWMDDYPDLREEYFNRLSPRQQETVNWYNSLSAADFERFKSINHAV